MISPHHFHPTNGGSSDSNAQQMSERIEHPIYIYGHSRFERWIVQLTVQLPAYILLLWMAFIAYILARNFAKGMVDWKVAAVIAVLIGIGCFIARLGLVDLPKPFEAYDREGALYVKRGKELFCVVGICDEYSVLMKTAFNKVPLLRLTCYCLKLDTSKGRRIVSFLSEGERHKFKLLVSRYVVRDSGEKSLLT
jgi:hypothetical protein